MEKRLILAIVLSFLVLFGYQALFVKPQKPAAPQPAPGAVETAAQVPGAVTAAPEQPKTAEAKPAPVAPVPAPVTAPTAGGDESEIVVDTTLYRAVWSNKGGVLKSWVLKKHKNSKKENLELVPYLAAEIGRFPFSLGLDDAALAGTPQFRTLPGFRRRARSGRRGRGRAPLLLFRRVLGPGREDLSLHRRQLRLRHGDPRLAERPAGLPVRPLGPGHQQPDRRGFEAELQRQPGLGRLHRRQSHPDERTEVQGRREHLQLRRLGGLRGELFRGPVRPAAAEGAGGLPQGDRDGGGRSGAGLFRVRDRAAHGLRRTQGQRCPQGLRPQRQEGHQLRHVRQHRRDPSRRRQVLPQARPELGRGHHPPDDRHQDPLLPADVQLDEVHGQDGRASSRRSRPCGPSTRSPRPTSISAGR